jgi:hypothetical protein
MDNLMKAHSLEYVRANCVRQRRTWIVNFPGGIPTSLRAAQGSLRGLVGDQRPMRRRILPRARFAASSALCAGQNSRVLGCWRPCGRWGYASTIRTIFSTMRLTAFCPGAGLGRDRFRCVDVRIATPLARYSAIGARSRAASPTSSAELLRNLVKIGGRLLAQILHQRGQLLDPVAARREGSLDADEKRLEPGIFLQVDKIR